MQPKEEDLTLEQEDLKEASDCCCCCERASDCDGVSDCCKYPDDPAAWCSAMVSEMGIRGVLETIARLTEENARIMFCPSCDGRGDEYTKGGYVPCRMCAGTGRLYLTPEEEGR